MLQIQCGRFNLDLRIPKIMGIVNLTPDSFSDGGVYSKSITLALKHAAQLVKSGADILDIGGESSRPGAIPVSAEEEWHRIKDVLNEVQHWNIPISLDTRKSIVMQKALDNNAVDIINDIEALQAEGSIKVLQGHPAVAIVLMHMQGCPATMQNNPKYYDVTQAVIQFLQTRICVCNDHGIKKERLILDPGIGFGKTPNQNLILIRGITTLIKKLQQPLLIGASRKSMFKAITGETNPTDRLGASIVAEMEAVGRGAKFIRTHNVKQTRQALLTHLAISSNDSINTHTDLSK